MRQGASPGARLVCSLPTPAAEGERAINEDEDRLQRRSAPDRGASRLDRDELRRLLHGTCPPADSPPPSHGRGVPAAVLIGLLGRPEGPSIILTQRTADLVNHPAEISLPGGRLEADDDGPDAAALREAFEEIGLPPEKVEILGCLPPSETISGFWVHPVVGWVDPQVQLEPDGREVAEVFEVPLSFVVDPTNHHQGSVIHGGEHHHFHVIPYPGRRIWGATAGILVDLARTIAR
jgi:8-oxo-dGTP pyrophosphatase MutT (NUDIX family)